MATSIDNFIGHLCHFRYGTSTSRPPSFDTIHIGSGHLKALDFHFRVLYTPSNQRNFTSSLHRAAGEGKDDSKWP